MMMVIESLAKFTRLSLTSLTFLELSMDPMVYCTTSRMLLTMFLRSSSSFDTTASPCG